MTIFAVFVTLYLFAGGVLLIYVAKEDSDGLRNAGKDCSVFGWIEAFVVWITCWLPLLVWDRHRDR